MSSKIIVIWDPVSGKVRNVKNVRVSTYDTGQVVEFTVVGANRDWPMFVPLEKFKETNPGVDLKDS